MIWSSRDNVRHTTASARKTEVALDELSDEEVFKTYSKKIELIDKSYA